MDLFSGRFTLDLVTLCLDMSTEELNDAIPGQPIGASEGNQPESANNLTPTPKPPLAYLLKKRPRNWFELLHQHLTVPPLRVCLLM